jgi:hypothetical protein
MIEGLDWLAYLICVDIGIVIGMFLNSLFRGPR